MDHQQPFSTLGASVTALGQFVVLPPDWRPELKAFVLLACSLFVGLVVPLLKEGLRVLARHAAEEMVGRKQVEAERDEARKALADSQAELRRLRERPAVNDGPPKRDDHTAEL